MHRQQVKRTKFYSDQQHSSPVVDQLLRSSLSTAALFWSNDSFWMTSSFCSYCPVEAAIGTACDTKPIVFWKHVLFVLQQQEPVPPKFLHFEGRKQNQIQLDVLYVMGKPSSSLIQYIQ